MSSLFHFYVVNIYVTCKSILYLASIFSISLIYILYISSLYTKCKWSDNNSLLIYTIIFFVRCKELGVVSGITERVKYCEGNTIFYQSNSNESFLFFLHIAKVSNISLLLQRMHRQFIKSWDRHCNT